MNMKKDNNLTEHKPANEHDSRKAIALKYDPELELAPRLIAKGEGELAQSIEYIAKQSGIPVTENKMLADSLFSLQAGAEIPENLYRSVAAVFAVLWEAEKKMTR